jgi:predicted PurR-regulated permease PerM
MWTTFCRATLYCGCLSIANGRQIGPYRLLMINSEGNPNKESASWRLSQRAWLALLALGLSLWLIITFGRVIAVLLWVLLGALLLSLAMRPAVRRAERHKWPRTLTVVGLYLVMFLVMVLLIELLLPVFRSELAQLQSNAPSLIAKVQSALAATPIARLLPDTGSLLSQFVQSLNAPLSTALQTVTGIGDLLLDLLVLFIMAYFLTVDAGWERRLLRSWLPADQQARAIQLVGIGLYFAVTFSTVLFILGIPFALTIGVVGGFLEIIPYIGGFIAALLAIMSALTVSPAKALLVFVFYVVVAVVEGHVVAPYLYGRFMGLRSAVALLALFVGARAAGIPGVLFAVPIVVILLTVLHELQSVRLATPEAEAEPES